MIPFTKAHACGNDFLIIDESLANRRHAALAQHLCARKTGLGADGIEFVDRRHRSGELFLRLFNADGSEAELSGNGTRCVAAFLAHTQHRDDVILGTHGGPRRCRVMSSEGNTYQIETGMGVPRVMSRSLSLAGLLDGSTEIEGAMVNVGNPHFVIFVESEDFSVHGLSWQELGARLAVDARFPHGTNVEFVRLLSPDQIAFRIFERGCGPTTSSGTGTCAAAAAAVALYDAAPSLAVFAEGGLQSVRWPAPHAEMLLTGPAELLCQGQAFDVATEQRSGAEALSL